MNHFSISTTIYNGENSLQRLANFKNQKIWIVCDAFLAKGEAIGRVREQLSYNQTEIYSDIQPDPDIQAVTAGMEALLKFKPDIVIGFGGGSAIDAAKAMVFFAAHINVKVQRFIAIPTTSGTGSEVTNVTVITDSTTGVKYPLFAESIYPDEAILDPTLVVTAPPAVTANTGMDALTHSIESCVSTKANDFCEAYAEKAIKTIFEYLPTAVKTGECIATRNKLHNAACMAGIAFSQSGLGINHAIAHQLGGKFHVAHGLANAILLPHTIRFNAKNDIRARKRYARIAKNCGFCGKEVPAESGVNQLIYRIQRLQRDLKIPKSLRALKISRQDVKNEMDAMVKSALLDTTMATNPVQANSKQVREIIEAIL